MTYFMNKTLEQLAKAPVHERLTFAAALIASAERRDSPRPNRLAMLRAAYTLVDQATKEIGASLVVMGVLPVRTEPDMGAVANVIRLVPKKKDEG